MGILQEILDKFSPPDSGFFEERLTHNPGMERRIPIDGANGMTSGVPADILENYINRRKNLDPETKAGLTQLLASYKKRAQEKPGETMIWIDPSVKDSWDFMKSKYSEFNNVLTHETLHSLYNQIPGIKNSDDLNKMARHAGIRFYSMAPENDANEALAYRASSPLTLRPGSPQANFINAVRAKMTPEQQKLYDKLRTRTRRRDDPDATTLPPE